MTILGTIRSYDEGRGLGANSPEVGGEVVRFGRSALREKDEESKEQERFSYEVGKDASGRNCAFNLHRIQAA
jgi:cold shock CspA family protein